MKQIFQKKVYQNINLEYKRIHLTETYIDKHLGECRSTLQNDEKVITGISVLTAEGNWSKDIFRNILSEIESTPEFRGLSASVELNYTNGKEKILNGNFEPISYYFAVSYRY